MDESQREAVIHACKVLLSPPWSTGYKKPESDKRNAKATLRSAFEAGYFEALTESERLCTLRHLSGETQRAIAADIGISKTRVSQVIAKAIRKINYHATRAA